MDRKIENAEWKLQYIKKYSKRNVVMIPIFTIIPAIFCCMAYFFNEYMCLVVGGIYAVFSITWNLQAIRKLQNLSKMTLIYKLSDDSFRDEWNDYVVAVDYSLNMEFEKKRKRK